MANSRDAAWQSSALDSIAQTHSRIAALCPKLPAGIFKGALRVVFVGFDGVQWVDCMRRGAERRRRGRRKFHACDHRVRADRCGIYRGAMGKS